VIYICGALWGLFVLCGGFIFIRNPVVKRKYNQMDIVKFFGYEEIKKEAESAGWQLERKEFLALVVTAVGTATFIALVIENVFYIIGGIVGGFYLPKFVVMQIKKHKRYSFFEALPDSLKFIVAKLIDYGSIPKAMESALPDIAPHIREPFNKFVKSIKLNLTVEQALKELANEVKIRKFTDFTETLLLAHTEGINEHSVNTLNTIIDTMVEDVRAIKNIQIICKKDKQDVLVVLLVCWFIPIALSFLNSNNINLFLDTFIGQMIMFSYFLTTIFVVVKGDEYSSLDLDEL